MGEKGWVKRQEVNKKRKGKEGTAKENNNNERDTSKQQGQSELSKRVTPVYRPSPTGGRLNPTNKTQLCPLSPFHFALVFTDRLLTSQALKKGPIN